MRLVRPFLLRNHGLTTSGRARAPLTYARRTLLTLAIETSCDDTAVAIVEKVGKSARIHFNERTTANQGQLKGIHPIVAQESHDARLAGLVDKALAHLPDLPGTHSNLRPLRLDPGSVLARKRLPDLVSVTRGPGMRSSLSVGLNVAKGLSVAWQVPLVGVHHMQAHALTPRLVHAMNIDNARYLPSIERSVPVLEPQFPYLTLLVSGGHTMIVRTADLTSHSIVVNTSDYALGDCLDKIGRTILPESIIAASTSPSYGALLESFAFPDGPATYAYRLMPESGSPVKSERYGWHVPVPYASPRGGRKPIEPVFSFTGIESQAVKIAQYGWDKSRDKFNRNPRTEPMPEEEARLLAREVMRIAFEHLAKNLMRALNDEIHSGASQSRALILSGGVASNQYLRHVVRYYAATRSIDLDIIAPPPSLCTDNAAMIGWAGCEMFERGFTDELDIRVLGTWSLENITSPGAEADGRTWLENNLPLDGKRKPAEEAVPALEATLMI